jgi:hypothetical protein
VPQSTLKLVSPQVADCEHVASTVKDSQTASEGFGSGLGSQGISSQALKSGTAVRRARTIADRGKLGRKERLVVVRALEPYQCTRLAADVRQSPSASHAT